MRRVIAMLLEVLLAPIYLSCGLLGYFVGAEPAKKGKKIVFAHGWMTSNLLYQPWKWYLEARGFSVYMPHFGMMLVDLKRNAKKLDDYVEENKLDDFVLVGLSAGALVSYDYLQRLGGWKRVRKFISVAGPLKGSPVAKLAFFSGSARQMSPGSKFSKEMSTKKPEHPERMVCIVAEYDELVPRQSSGIKGVQTEIIPAVGHIAVQTVSLETYALVSEVAR